MQDFATLFTFNDSNPLQNPSKITRNREIHTKSWDFKGFWRIMSNFFSHLCI